MLQHCCPSQNNASVKIGTPSPRVMKRPLSHDEAMVLLEKTIEGIREFNRLFNGAVNKDDPKVSPDKS